MDYYGQIRDLWLAGQTDEAIKLKEKCLKENLLTDEEKEKLHYVPDSQWKAFVKDLGDPPKEKIPVYSQGFYRILKDMGFSDHELQVRLRLRGEDLDLIQSGKLRRRSTYNAFITRAVDLWDSASKTEKKA